MGRCQSFVLLAPESRFYNHGGDCIPRQKCRRSNEDDLPSRWLKNMNVKPGRDVEIFAAAKELSSDERAAYLARECGGDRALRARVEALVRADLEAGRFMESLPGDPQARKFNAIGEKPGDRIGRYTLLQQIGEGGCGVVFMAQQTEPVRRLVALKVIRPGMDTKSVIVRFEAERQALALMDHPNIARVLDAGATGAGRPYFVMELVRGSKITDYCDRHSLPNRARLDLFMQVCLAVQHAHQKGIIHRDLKPSNILVTADVDGRPLPKIIDFGIAKATTGLQLTDKTLFTAFELLIGTPAYMSPEQAALTSVDVDTRSDIYSLGVLLYELLTGTTPFDAAGLLKAGLDEVRRVIMNQEPARPSTRLSTMLAADVAAVSHHRQSEPPKLIRELRGDLDWIVMKALEKDRTRRYPTANGLLLDVQRFLANEVISARPPGTFYRLRKTIQRNKLLFGAVGIVGLLMGTSLLAIGASLRRERQARFRAQTEQARSGEVTRLLKSMLEGVGPSVARGRSTEMLREILDRTARQIGEATATQPAVEAEIRSLVGRLDLQTGNYARSEEMHRRALTLQRQLFGPQSLEVATSLDDLGATHRKTGNLAAAEAAFAEAVAIRRRVTGNEHPDLATSMDNLANIRRRQGRASEAEALAREALAMRRELLGSEHLAVAESLRTLCILLGDARRHEESVAAGREVLALRRKFLGNDDPSVASALVDLAWAVGFRGDLAEAEALEKEALEIQRRLLGDQHPDVIKTYYLLGDRLRQRGKLGESHSLLSSVLGLQRKMLGDDSPASLDSLHSFGLTLEAEGRMTEAEQAFRDGLALWRRRGEGQGRQAAANAESLARVLTTQRRYSEAAQTLDETLSPDFLKETASANLLGMRAELRGRAGRFAEAAADATVALKHQPRYDERYSMLALYLAKSRDQAGYDRLCAQIPAAFPHPANVYAADKLAKACLLLPSSAVDLETVSRWADIAVTDGVNEPHVMPFFQLCKAWSEYRLGRFAGAIQWAQKSADSSQWMARGPACGILAMAHWQLGDHERAKAALAKGNSATPDMMPAFGPKEPDNAWQGWAYSRIALDEAEVLIHAAATDPKPENP